MLDLIVAVILAFFAICVGILLCGDCDIWTFMHLKFGKDIGMWNYTFLIQIG